MQNTTNQLIIQYSNLNEFFFPIDFHDLYFDVTKHKDKKTRVLLPKNPKFAEDFIALIDEERLEMLSCVSKSYTLVTNEWAFNIGTSVAKHIFKVGERDIAFWQGELTEKRRACTMDIRVNKILNISGVKHNWFAFVRINNSYDKTRSLSYDIGFCLETMDNREVPIGLLVPSLSLHFAANHIWMLETIERKLWDALECQYKHRDIFSEFEMMVTELLGIEVIDDEILSLFCRLAKLKKLDPNSEQDRRLASKIIVIEKDSKYWIKKCGPNAYAALCAYADYASKYVKDVSFLDTPSEFQSQLGRFVDELINAKRQDKINFSLDDFIGKQAREVKKQIKLICANE